MTIGLLTGVTKAKSQIDIIFEVYSTLTGAENTYSLFGGKINVAQNTGGGFTLNLAGVQVADKKQEKPDMKVLTFNDFKRSASGRWATHEIIGKKAKLEYISPGLEEISFSILLSAGLGVAPEDELAKLRQIRDEGITCTLVIGDKPITDNLVAVQKVEEDHRYYDNKGNLLAAFVNVSLMEYVNSEPEEPVEESGESGV